MASTEGDNSDGSTEPMPDRRSPPAYRNGPPIFCLMDIIRPVISADEFFRRPRVAFSGDLLTQANPGDYFIPLLIAAPMLILHAKHTEELNQDYRRSFLSRLDFPTLPNTDPPEIIEELTMFLREADTLEECQERFATVSTRVVFEVLVDVIQAVQFLFVPISNDTAMAMLNVDFINHKYGGLNDAFPPADSESAYVNQVTQDIIVDDFYKRRAPNILHYLWFKDLENLVDKEVGLVFRFLVLNLMQMLRQYCLAAGASTAGVDEGQFLLIDYAQMHAGAIEEVLRVLGNKLGRYLIRAPAAFHRQVYQESPLRELSELVIGGKFLINLLLMNQPDVWFPAAEVQDFILHDQPDCNFHVEQCICQPFKSHFPHVVESMTAGDSP